MEPSYNSKYSQKVLIPHGILSPDENNIIDVPGLDEEVFVASKPRSQHPSHSKRNPQSGRQGSVPESSHPEHFVVSVGPEPVELETREQENFEEDLKNFQTARRKLFYDVMTLQMTKLKKRAKKHLLKK